MNPEDVNLSTAIDEDGPGALAPEHPAAVDAPISAGEVLSQTTHDVEPAGGGSDDTER